MADILKFMHCGCEYNFCSTKAPPFPEDIFGDGSDGNCTITYDASTYGVKYLEAKTWNFNNLTIESGAELRFCGEGIPFLKVKGCFVNNGTINSRNQFLCRDYEKYIPEIDKVMYIQGNGLYSALEPLLTDLTLECLSGRSCGGKYNGSTTYSMGGYGGGAGESGGTGCSAPAPTCGGATHTGGAGGTSAYQNAGGGGGGGAMQSYCTQYGADGCPGCPAPSDGVGGKGGDSCGGAYEGNIAWKGGGSGGGGGYGYCQGGDGGNSYIACNGTAGGGGDGGNSYIGNGGNGGQGNPWGKGGNSYYGNGGNTCVGNKGGCSYWGNGGCSFSGDGGYSVQGKGGDTCCCFSYGFTNSNCPRGRSWCGMYDIILATNNFYNCGTITSKGGNSGSAMPGNPGGGIYIVTGGDYENAGTIVCSGGSGCTLGKSGYVKCYFM